MRMKNNLLPINLTSATEVEMFFGRKQIPKAFYNTLEYPVETPTLVSCVSNMAQTSECRLMIDLGFI